MKNQMPNQIGRTSRKRNRGGVLLVVVVCAFAIVLVVPLILKWQCLLISHERNMTAAESAALAAAQDLGRIVVEDPYYGYIGLVDQTPIGSKLKAADGEPLPVVGINTIVATARQITILADAIGSDELRRLAHRECIESRRASRLLEKALADSIDPDSLYKPQDLNGEALSPYQRAKSVFLLNFRNVPALGNANLSRFELSLGWLSSGGDSQVSAPNSVPFAQLPGNSLLPNGNYAAYKNIPYNDESFYFAGLSRSAAIADSNHFQKADGIHLSSIVHVRAVIEHRKTDSSNDGLICAASAESKFEKPRSTPPVLALHFPHGLVQGINSINDLISKQELKRKRTEIHTAAYGDFPDDSGSQLVPTVSMTGDTRPTISDTVAESLFCWVRSAGTRARLDSVLAALQSSFVDTNRAAPILLIYDFDRDGKVVTLKPAVSPFPQTTVSERQSFAYAEDAVEAGALKWTFSCRNFSQHMGSLAGGRHAGQPLCGDPVNWCELAAFGGTKESARLRAKGGNELGLRVEGKKSSADLSGEGIARDGARLCTADGRAIQNPPRKSFYSGGLSAYIEISAPRLISQTQ